MISSASSSASSGNGNDAFLDHFQLQLVRLCFGKIRNDRREIALDSQLKLRRFDYGLCAEMWREPGFALFQLNRQVFNLQLDRLGNQRRRTQTFDNTVQLTTQSRSRGGSCIALIDSRLCSSTATASRTTSQSAALNSSAALLCAGDAQLQRMPQFAHVGKTGGTVDTAQRMCRMQQAFRSRRIRCVYQRLQLLMQPGQTLPASLVKMSNNTGEMLTAPIWISSPLARRQRLRLHDGNWLERVFQRQQRAVLPAPVRQQRALLGRQLCCRLQLDDLRQFQFGDKRSGSTTVSIAMASAGNSGASLLNFLQSVERQSPRMPAAPRQAPAQP